MHDEKPVVLHKVTANTFAVIGLFASIIGIVCFFTGRTKFADFVGRINTTSFSTSSQNSAISSSSTHKGVTPVPAPVHKKIDASSLTGKDVNTYTKKDWELYAKIANEHQIEIEKNLKEKKDREEATSRKRALIVVHLAVLLLFLISYYEYRKG